MADDALMQAVTTAPQPVLPSFSYARDGGPLAAPIRYGYSCEHKLDVGPSQMRLDSVHVFPYDGDENRCRACVAGTCVQRVELWPHNIVYVVHDCRDELS